MIKDGEAIHYHNGYFEIKGKYYQLKDEDITIELNKLIKGLLNQ
jgi:hypothetical protein